MNGTGKYDHSFVIKRWSNMKTDLETCWPDYYDIKKDTKELEGTVHEVKVI